MSPPTLSFTHLVNLLFSRLQVMMSEEASEESGQERKRQGKRCYYHKNVSIFYQEPQKPMKMSYLQKTRCFLGKHDVFGKHRIFDFKQFPIHSFNSSSVLKRSQKHHLNLRISHRPPLCTRNEISFAFATRLSQLQPERRRPGTQIVKSTTVL